MRTLPWLLIASTSSFSTPTASVSSESETANPNWSLAAPSEAVNVACALHDVPLRTNTRTLPWLPFAPTSSNGTPTASVSPDSETASPKLKLSPTAPSAANTVASSGYRSFNVCACTDGASNIETSASAAVSNERWIGFFIG